MYITSRCNHTYKNSKMSDMARDDRSAPLWQKLRYAMYIPATDYYFLATKWSPYEPASLVVSSARDLVVSCVLLTGYTVGTIAAGVVVYQWVHTNETAGNDARDGLFKAVAGSTAFGFLLVVLLAVLSIWNCCILYEKHNVILQRHREKRAQNITKV